MSDPRARLLGAIRGALGRGPLPEPEAAELRRRLDHPPPRPVPARGRIEGEARAELFVAEAERVNASVERIRDLAAVPGAVAHYLRAANLPMVLRLAPDPALDPVPWEREPALSVDRGVGRDGDKVSLSPAFAGIAETGTVMLVSGGARPTTLTFLPDHHLVLLPAGRIAGTYEEAWAWLRAEYGAGNLPRVVNWVTGPSRTADIEQTLLLGAHGPLRLHILLCDGEAA